MIVNIEDPEDEREARLKIMDCDRFRQRLNRNLRPIPVVNNENGVKATIQAFTEEITQTL